MEQIYDNCLKAQLVSPQTEPPPAEWEKRVGEKRVGEKRVGSIRGFLDMTGLGMKPRLSAAITDITSADCQYVEARCRAAVARVSAARVWQIGELTPLSFPSFWLRFVRCAPLVIRTYCRSPVCLRFSVIAMFSLADVTSLIKKKPGAAKKGLGAKKAGLGAQKVSSKSFSEIEKQAQAVDKIKEQEMANLSKKAEEPIVSSLRLAYKDLEIQKQKDDEKMKHLPAKKKAEAERLGMGFGNRGGISHSVLSEMQTIEQEAPKASKPKKIYHNEDQEDFYFGGGSRSRYRDDPPEPVTSSFLSWDERSDDFWKKETSNNDFDTTLSSKTSSYDERPATRRKPDLDPAPATDDAQKKFGNAKAISSDMYFGKQDHADYEARARLERLSGNASISSADLFDDHKKQASANYNLSNVLPSAPDMANFKQGVKSVAGRLSVLASGVMTTIQDRYGS